jgi:hypothetical protein
MTTAQSYEVGYGRPPTAHQFPKGQSGNPSGRPKGSKNISAVIAAALSERVTVTVKGKRRSITKLEAAVTQMANKAAGGDQKAAKLIIELLHQSEIRDEARTVGSLVSPEERQAQDAAFLAAFRASTLNIVPETAQ